MTIKYSNNARTTLTSAVLDTDTSISVADASVFPALGVDDTMYLTLSDPANTVTEIVLCTAISGNVLTVQRGYDNTVTRGWSADDVVSSRLTAGMLDTLLGDKISTFEEVQQPYQEQSGAYFSKLVFSDVVQDWADGAIDPVIAAVPWTSSTARTEMIITLHHDKGATQLLLKMTPASGGRVAVSYYCVSGVPINISGNTYRDATNNICYVQIDSVLYFAGGNTGCYAVSIDNLLRADTAVPFDRSVIAVGQLSTSTPTGTAMPFSIMTEEGRVSVAEVEGLSTQLFGKLAKEDTLDDGTYYSTVLRRDPLASTETVDFSTSAYKIDMGLSLVAGESVELDFRVVSAGEGISYIKLYIIYSTSGPPTLHGLRCFSGGNIKFTPQGWVWEDSTTGFSCVAITDITATGGAALGTNTQIFLERSVIRQLSTEPRAFSFTSAVITDLTEASGGSSFVSSDLLSKDKITATDATTSTSGWMSAADKTKLDSLTVSSGTEVITYDNRNMLRTMTPADKDQAIIQDLGLFVFRTGVSEIDDDETCFVADNGSGAWLIEALGEGVARVLVAEEAPNVITGTSADSPITSISSSTSLSFTISMPGCPAGTPIVVMPPSVLNWRINTYAICVTAGIAEVYVVNPSASTSPVPSGIWKCSAVI